MESTAPQNETAAASMTEQPDIQTEDPEPGPGQRSPDVLLAWKMVQVMGKIDRIKKAGQNKDQGWKFATIDDITDVIRAEMATVGLAVFPRMLESKVGPAKTPKGSDVNRATVKMEFKLVCSDTGAFEVMTWDGTADDSSDKALTKAITYAKKTWLMASFMVSTGDDPDAESPGEETQKSTRRDNKPRQQSQRVEDTRQQSGQQIQIVMKRDEIDALVNRARAAGYIEEKQGEKDLLKLIGKTSWSGYTLATAAAYVKETVEKLKAAIPAAAGKPAAPAALPPAVPVVERNKKVIVEFARYNGKVISFQLPDGKWIPFFKGRTELARLTGAEFANEWHIGNWTGTQEKPEVYEFGPLQVSYHEDKGKLIFGTAAAIPLDDDEPPLPDMTDEEIDAALAAAESASSDVDTFFAGAGSPITQHA